MNSDCGFCKRRGAACVRHGGTDSQKYVRSDTRADGTPRKSIAEIRAEKGKTLGEQFGHRIDAYEIPKLKPFEDKYNCSMCSLKGSLCEMHEQFERKPQPTSIVKTAPKPTPAGVKTSEEQSGEFRVVQIKVGEITITIKEPARELVK